MQQSMCKVNIIRITYVDEKFPMIILKQIQICLSI